MHTAMQVARNPQAAALQVQVENPSSIKQTAFETTFIAVSFHIIMQRVVLALALLVPMVLCDGDSVGEGFDCQIQ